MAKVRRMGGHMPPSSPEDVDRFFGVEVTLSEGERRRERDLLDCVRKNGRLFSYSDDWRHAYIYNDGTLTTPFAISDEILRHMRDMPFRETSLWIKPVIGILHFRMKVKT